MMIQIRDLIGKPYKVHGRGPEAYDCYGLVIEVSRRFGRLLPDLFYEKTGVEINAKLIGSGKSAITAYKIPEPVEGAVVVLIIKGKPHHVGVCIGDGNFIHATEDTGVRVDSLASYRSKIEGFYLW